MTALFEVECAVWHPTAEADLIAEAVGLAPEAGGSVGTAHHITGRARDRTYCRFHLGAFSQDELSEGLQMLKRFTALKPLSLFNDGKGMITVYLRKADDAPELYLNLRALEMLRQLNSSVVVW